MSTYFWPYSVFSLDFFFPSHFLLITVWLGLTLTVVRLPVSVLLFSLQAAARWQKLNIRYFSGRWLTVFGEWGVTDVPFPPPPPAAVYDIWRTLAAPWRPAACRSSPSCWGRSLRPPWISGRHDVTLPAFQDFNIYLQDGEKNHFSINMSGSQPFCSMKNKPMPVCVKD